MTASFVGPRSSTPKLSQVPNRALPKVPKASTTEPKKTSRHGRVLPLIPATQPHDGPKASRSLPRVPGPITIKSPPGTSGSGSSNKSNNSNPAIPTVPKTTRQLPKIPKVNTVQSKRIEQDRKKYMHTIYKSEGDDHLRKGELDKALESYHGVSRCLTMLMCFEVWKCLSKQNFVL
jgi:hypothetical protein